MESQAGAVFQFAVACKFLAALCLGPLLAGCQQLPGNAAPAVCGQDENAFQVAGGAVLCAFYIVAAQLALGEAHRSAVNAAEVNDAVRRVKQFLELFGQDLRRGLNSWAAKAETAGISNFWAWRIIGGSLLL